MPQTSVMLTCAYVWLCIRALAVYLIWFDEERPNLEKLHGNMNKYFTNVEVTLDSLTVYYLLGWDLGGGQTIPIFKICPSRDDNKDCF